MFRPKCFQLDQAGVATIETSLVLILFLAAIFCTVELGRLLQVQHSLSNAAREGATYAVRPSPGTAGLPSDELVIEVINKYLSSINLATTSVTIERPVLIDAGIVTGEFTLVRVETDYEVISLSMFADIQATLSGEALMRNETSP